MNPKTIKRTGAILLIAAAVGCIGVFMLFYRMGRNDTKAILGFADAYQRYDAAIGAFEKSAVDVNEAEGALVVLRARVEVEGALADLRARAGTRISSLTKNDGAIMWSMTTIAGAAGNELAALDALRQAKAKTGDLGTLSKAYEDLKAARQKGYAQFRALAGMSGE